MALEIPLIPSYFAPSRENTHWMVQLQQIKNTAERCFKKTLSEEGVIAYQSIENECNKFGVQGVVSPELVQFYFALSGSYTYSFGPSYSLTLKEGDYFFFYNPTKELSFTINGPENGKWVALFISVEQLHKLFTHQDQALPFLTGENAKKVLYESNAMNAQIQLSLHQLYSMDIPDLAFEVFVRGKMYEVLALHFASIEKSEVACPFLRDAESLQRIRAAKELLISNLVDPISVSQLAEKVGISEYKLKSGFKEVYSNTVYGYLLDYKLNYARHLLDLGKMQVYEVGYEVGYNNPSHFISAFKKKFNVTPKKYLQGK